MDEFARRMGPAGSCVQETTDRTDLYVRLTTIMKQMQAPNVLPFAKYFSTACVICSTTAEQLLCTCIDTGDKSGTAYKHLFNNNILKISHIVKGERPVLHPKLKGLNLDKNKRGLPCPPSASGYRSGLYNCLCHHSAATLIIITAGEIESSKKVFGSSSNELPVKTEQER